MNAMVVFSRGGLPLLTIVFRMFDSLLPSPAVSVRMSKKSGMMVMIKRIMIDSLWNMVIQCVI